MIILKKTMKILILFCSFKTETDTQQTHQEEDDPDKIFCFNVGGKRFESLGKFLFFNLVHFRYYCMRKNFERFPDTKLGELVRLILKYLCFARLHTKIQNTLYTL